MPRLCVALFLLASAAFAAIDFLPTADQNGVSDHEVCIIGAGPSGVGAAHHLVQKGYSNILMLEKLDRIGGKCRDIERVDNANGKPVNRTYPLGQIVIIRDYEEIRELADIYGQKFELFALGVPQDFYVDFNAKPLFTPAPPSWPTIASFSPLELNSIEDIEEITVALTAATAYTAIWKSYVAIDEKTGEPDPKRPLGDEPTLSSIDFDRYPELADPANKFIADRFTEYGLGPKHIEFMQRAQFPLEASGYLSADFTPMAYFFKAFTPPLLVEGVLGTIQRIVGGCTALLEAMVDTLSAKGKLEVLLSAEIVNTVREPDQPSLVQLSDGTERTCDRIIVAFPQITADMQFLGLDEEESDVFGRVFIAPYASTLLDFSYEKMPNTKSSRLYGNLDTSVEPHAYRSVVGKGQPAVIAAPYGSQAGAGLLIYQSYDRQQGLWNETLKQDSVQIVTDMFFDGDASEYKANLTEVDFWTYFPHVSGEELRAGFYQRLEALQGKKKTYWTGGLLNYDTVGTSMDYSRYLIDTYF
uniref:Amine oxidase domain-containing protein n=1 Tax=Vitrella brassicaformis TaxID=1169539 RepID=A0A7S1PDG9_9ALVE